MWQNTNQKITAEQFWRCSLTSNFYRTPSLGTRNYLQYFNNCCCCSVSKSWPTLCDPMDCSMSGSPCFTISRNLLKLMSIELVMPSNHLILCHPLAPRLQSFPASGSFPMSRLFASGDQNLRASALASVLPMNIQDWFPLGLIGLISLLSKGLSRFFSSITTWKHMVLFQPPFLQSSESKEKQLAHGIKFKCLWTLDHLIRHSHQGFSLNNVCSQECQKPAARSWHLQH